MTLDTNRITLCDLIGGTGAGAVLGPSGSWWLKDRVDGVIETLTSHRVKEATANGSGVRLLLDGGQQVGAVELGGDVDGQI